MTNNLKHLIADLDAIIASDRDAYAHLNLRDTLTLALDTLIDDMHDCDDDDTPYDSNIDDALAFRDMIIA